jgi:PhoH-like ATPase
MDFKQVVVLDTNVLVDDYKAILKFEDSLVVIPRVVIEELDGLKNNRDGNKRAVVRRASWLLDEITEEFADEELMPLETKGSYLKIEGNYRNQFESYEPEKPDNRIISVAVGYAKEGHNVILYSNDVNVRVTARSVAREQKINLKSARYKMIDTSLREISTGVQNLFFSAETLIKTRSRGHLEIELPYMNGEHIFMIDEANASHIILGQYDSVHKKIVMLPDYKTGTPIWRAGDDNVIPRDARQTFLAHDMLNKEKYIHFVLSRVAGAGKNYITTACALRLLKDGEYDRFMMIKPMIESEGQGTGYLPGTKEEKLAPWFDSFKDTMFELTNDGQTLPSELEGRIELDVVTHMRGRSIPRTIMVIDECQNFSAEAIKTLLTRAGEDTKIVLTGDLSQIDNPRLDSENNGLRVWAERARHPELGFDRSTYILLDSNFRSDLSAWASSFYE